MKVFYWAALILCCISIPVSVIAATFFCMSVGSNLTALVFMVVFGIVVFPVSTAFLLIANHLSSNLFFCIVLGWHLAPNAQGFDGCSKTGVCPRCGKSVLQDGQGNWF
jgi:hypothetical protein